MKFVDSHCHLDRYEDLAEVLSRAEKNAIEHIVSICVSRSNFTKVMEVLHNSPPWVSASIGIHPSEVEHEDLESLESWLLHHAQHPRVVGIGETGFDHTPNFPSPEAQLASFRLHHGAALATGLPLLVHLRDAEASFFSYMRTQPKRATGLLHCFTASLSCAQEVLSWGWKISLSGILTFPNASDLRETVRQLPISGFLLETDGPWLAPQPYRGQRNESAYLVETAKTLAMTLNVSLEDVAYHTTNTFYALFPKASRPNVK
jgi:TatD DNase family protein